MRLLLSAIAIAVATAALLVGCNTGNGVVTVASTQSNVRVINLIPNAGAPLVVTLDDNFFASGVAFQSLSLYQTIKAGVHTFRAFVTGAPSNVIATDVATLGEANYSYIMPIFTSVGKRSCGSTRTSSASYSPNASSGSSVTEHESPTAFAARASSTLGNMP